MAAFASGASNRWVARAERAILVVVLCAVLIGSYAALPSAAGASTPAAPGVAGGHSPAAAGTAGVPPSVAPAAASLAPTSWVTPRVTFQVHGPHPASWGGPTPPGAPTPELPQPGSGGWWGGDQSDLNDRCAGVWPSVAGQSQYYGSCYGHDEPGIDPYSALPGSGGNVTWNLQLPVDRSPTANQSSLYIAIWFGMTLTDPYAWMDQCFLELQFYPDSSWSNPTGTVDGVWDGAAVAWQIQASTGFETPCYYSPLMQHGGHGAYFQMTQGDSINVTMNGWIGDPYGENISVQDDSSGQSSVLTMYNSSGNYPVDPAYSTSGWANSLWWTPGGETPVSFAFETGHAANPLIPENNSYDGCSPGTPPSTALDGAVPCPSYDPGSWANDTLQPWEIHAPTFFNAATRQTAAQVGFTQDLGGLGFIDGDDGLGSWTCLGHETSAYCAYPWYSFSCSTDAYNFGATDYPTTSDDFGKALEFQQATTANAAGLGYYLPTNESVPSCGSSSTVTVDSTGSGNGTVDFLDRTVPNTVRVFDNVSAGNYSLDAQPAAGYEFVDWGVGGGASVASTADAYTNVDVTGPCVLTANFAAIGSSGGNDANVTFLSANGEANVSVVAGFSSASFGAHAALDTWQVTNGTTLDLHPGLYSLAAEPPSGYNFTGWQTSGALRLSTPTLPNTILDVPVDSTGNVTATYTQAVAYAGVLIYTPNPADIVRLDGSNYSGGASFASLLPGSYTLSYAPAPGGRFQTWEYGGLAVMTNFSQTTWVTLEGGLSEILAVGYTLENVTLNTTAGAGEVTWNAPENVSAVAVPSGTTFVLNTSSASPGDPAVFGLVATPAAGWSFANWSVSNGTAAYLSHPFGFTTNVVLNSTGVAPLTLTANFVAGGTVLGNLTVYPSGAGSVDLGYATGPLTNGTGGVPNGTFYVVQAPSPGYVVRGLTVTNGTASLVQGTTPTTQPWSPWVWLVTIVGPTAATLNATFAPLTYPVTFVANSPVGNPVGTVNGTALGGDGTVWLANGTYSLSVVLGTNVRFVDWTASWGRLVVATPSLSTTMVTVTGPGTLYALGTVPAPSPLVAASIAPASDVLSPGGAAEFNATVRCIGNTTCPAGTTFVWSLSNSSLGTLNATNGTTVTFAAGAAVFGTTNLTVNATLNGTSVVSPTVPISVVPALTGATIDNAPSQLYAGQSAALEGTVGCTGGLPCPAGATFLWSAATPSLGSVAPTTGSGTTFRSSAGVVGTEVVSVTAMLGGRNATAMSSIAIVLPILTSVTVSPLSLTTGAGATTDLFATPGCSASLACPTGTTFAWTVAPSTLGTFGSATGASTNFTAGTTNESGWVNVTGTLSGVAIAAAAINVSVETATPVLVGVSVTPSAPAVTVGTTETFTATLACSPAPCPTGGTVLWAIAGPVGSLSTTSGSTTTLTTTHAGNATVYANATLDGKTLGGSTSVRVNPSGSTPGTSSGTPLDQNPLLWIAIVVVVIVIVAAAILMRRGPTDPAAPATTGTTAATATTAETPPKSP
ncbi:MAG: hypothetical protein L3K16_08460 [Thermoplasmata archaeon]|nr:hypothetical protein [Thermoplasmata archaeon]